MKLENYIRVIAGLFVFVSALLGYLHHKYWLFFTMFVGLNLFQYGFTNFCPMALILKKLGIKESCCSIESETEK
ncbi:DUF2892 domain-containing protein [bacterium]|nr:DUF2892 domain-containing protein [bacterium]